MKATPVEFPKLWLIQGPTDGYGVGVAFVDEDEARREAECWGGEEVYGPFLPVSDPGAWLVKNHDGAYVSETAPGCVWFTDHQREAKRYHDQGKAYRLAMKWDLGSVVRLRPRSIPAPPKSTGTP